jgi:carbonic anhydrase
MENNSNNDEYVNQIAKVNVLQTIESIRQKSEVLRKLELEGKIKIVGAFYRLQSGMVDVI